MVVDVAERGRVSPRAVAQKTAATTDRTRYHSASWASIADADEQEGAVHRSRVATLRILVALIAAVLLAGATLTAQSTATKVGPAPRAADGHLDLSGVWGHNAAAPPERPDEFAGRATLTDSEVTQRHAKAAQLVNGHRGARF